jgi:hypothetical protein
MFTLKSYVSSVPLFIAAIVALSGCDRGPVPSANLSYRQVGICKGYDTASGPVKAGADEGFAIFKIEALDNSKPSTSFTFDPALLYADQSTPAQKAGNVWNWNRHFVAMNPRFWQGLGLQAPERIVVPSGKKVEIDRFVSIPVGLNNPSGGPEANRLTFEFVYDTETARQGEKTVNEGIVFTKTSSAETVLDDCKALVTK